MTAVPHNLAAVKGGWIARLLAMLRLPAWKRRDAASMLGSASPTDRPWREIDARGAVIIRAPEDLSEEEAVRVIHARAREAIAAGATTLMVDLADVIRADTKIVACLVVLRRMARRSGCALDVRLSPAVAAWTGVCRLQQVIHEEDSRHSAA